MKKLIKFEKDNCPACKQVEMFLMNNRTKAKIINPFENPELAGKFNISSVPVTILLNFKDEDLAKDFETSEEALKILLENDLEEITRSIGFKVDELEEMIENLK